MRQSFGPDVKIAWSPWRESWELDVINTETGWKTTELYADAYGTFPGGSQRNLEGGQHLLGSEVPCSSKCGQVLATYD